MIYLFSTGTAENVSAIDTMIEELQPLLSDERRQMKEALKGGQDVRDAALNTFTREGELLLFHSY